MEKPSDQPNGSANLLLAVSMLTVFAGITALACAYTSGHVLDTLQSRDAIVMIVTDAGVRSDSQRVEENLSSATVALLAIRDLGLALSFGCLGVAVAVGIRVWRGRRQG